jgi:hypothetical protein
MLIDRGQLVACSPTHFGSRRRRPIQLVPSASPLILKHPP